MAQSAHGYLVVDEYFRPGSVHSCTDYATYRLNIQSGAKMGIEIFRNKSLLRTNFVRIWIFGIP